MNVGDIVISRSPKLRGTQGIVVDIVEREAKGRFDTGELFVVLWNTGQLDEYQEWDLSEVKDL